jgi:hypothetical protein
MWIMLARKGWRTHEPLDNDLPMEEPKVCRNAVELMIEKGVVTKADFLAQGFASQDDIESLMCLPEGYLTPKMNPVLSPVGQLKGQQGANTAQRTSSSKVVPIRERK